MPKDKFKLFFSDPKKIFLYPLIKKVERFTQLRPGGLYQMYDLLNLIDQNKTRGCVVEMGCGRGGCGAFVAKVIKDQNSNRDVWLFDSFEGLSEPDASKDFKGSAKESHKIKKGYLKVEKKDVTEALRKVNLDKDKSVHVVEGWFKESLPQVKENIGEIAILRLDADLYEPTLYCLDELYQSVSIGGYVVIDDYKNWIGTRKALYEFFARNDISPYIEIYPHGGVAYFQKII